MKAWPATRPPGASAAIPDMATETSIARIRKLIQPVSWQHATQASTSGQPVRPGEGAKWAGSSRVSSGPGAGRRSPGGDCGTQHGLTELLDEVAVPVQAAHEGGQAHPRRSAGEVGQLPTGGLEPPRRPRQPSARWGDSREQALGAEAATDAARYWPRCVRAGSVQHRQRRRPPGWRWGGSAGGAAQASAVGGGRRARAAGRS